MADKQSWYCVRQRAGPLTKECRAIRPRLSADDTAWDRTEKNKILRPPGDSSVCRNRVDRLELRLALFGSEGRVYCLTFDPEHDPATFPDARKSWRSFLRRLKLQAGHPIDYVYLIEGRHGDHRYHVHLVLRTSDFSDIEVAACWRFGRVLQPEPLLCGPRDTYRRTARYFNKEATDGIIIPISARQWVASPSLNRQLPPIELFVSDSGWIPMPVVVRASGVYTTANTFGQYRYAWFIDL